MFILVSINLSMNVTYFSNPKNEMIVEKSIDYHSYTKLI